MTNYIRKFELGGLHIESTKDATTYVGDKNDVWTDDNAPGTWRIGDGVTPGGVVLFSASGGGASGIALTDISVVQNPVGIAGLSWNNVTGVLTYTPPDLTGYALSNSVPGDLTELGINDGTNGQVLTTDGAGTFTFTTLPSTGITYSDLSVTQNPSAGLGTLAYNNTTGTFTYTPPVIPTDVSDLTDTTNLLSGGGAGISLTDISVGAEDPASGDGGISYDNTTGVFTYTPPDLSGYQPTSNVTADIDGHLNTSTAGANEVLSWDGADYAWVSNAGGGGTDATTFDGQAPSYYLDYTNFTNTPTIPTDYGDHSTQGYLTSYTETDTLQSVIDRGNTSTTTAVIPFLYADQTAFPNASTYHGAIAHSHSDGAMYFAHGGVWNKLANDSQLSAYLTSYTVTESDVTAHEAALTITESQISDLGSYSTFDGDYNSLTNTPTIPVDVSDLTDTTNLLVHNTFDGQYSSLTGAPTIPSDVSDLTDTTNLLVHNTFDGDYNSLTNTPTIPADVSDLTDTTSLLFDGDYTSLTNTPTIPADVSDLTDTTNLLSSGGVALTDLSVTTAANGVASLSYDNTSGVFTFTPPDLSGYLVSGGTINVSTIEPTATTSGDGDDLTITGGDATDLNSQGGDTIITGGSGALTSGSVDIGTTQTDAITIGATGISTTIGDTLTVNGNATFESGTFEAFSTITGASGTVTHDCDNGHIFYHTSPSANFTANFTNLGLSTNYGTGITLVIDQGATARIPSAVQTDGNSRTIVWQGGSAPSGTNNGVDVVSFSILRTSGSYIVLGQLVDFA